MLKVIDSFKTYYANPNNDYLFEEFIGNIYNLLQSVKDLESFLGESKKFSLLIDILDSDVDVPEHLSRRFSFNGTYYDLFKHSRNMDGHLDKINRSNELLIAKGLKQSFYIEILKLINEIHVNRTKKLQKKKFIFIFLRHNILIHF